VALFFLHGIVEAWSPSFVNRNYCSRAAFEAHLRARATPYGRWEDAGHEDHLSVDDSTRAGAAACMVARELGHEVVFFINPLQIETGEPYFFSLLDAAIDARAVDTIRYAEASFNLTTYSERRRFRRAVKAVVMRLSSHEATETTREVAHSLGVDQVEAAEHALPLTYGELEQLAAAGVRIENHGWSHIEIASLDRDGFEEHVRRGREWIRRRLDWEARLYAVPFGLTDVPHDWAELAGDAHLLAREDLPPAQLDTGCWNRHDLTGRLQSA
jgi:hypothetical protein